MTSRETSFPYNVLGEALKLYSFNLTSKIGSHCGFNNVYKVLKDYKFEKNHSRATTIPLITGSFHKTQFSAHVHVNEHRFTKLVAGIQK